MDVLYAAMNPDIKVIWLLIGAVLAVVMLLMAFVFPGFRKINISRQICAVVLVEYIFLVLASTVLSRATKKNYQYELEVFWSYKKIAAGNIINLWENVLNILLLMPIGFLLPNVIRLSHVYRITVFVGFCTSCMIELLQLIFKRGLFEFDDIIHNTLGVAIGMAGYYVIKRMRNEGWR